MYDSCAQWYAHIWAVLKVPCWFRFSLGLPSVSALTLLVGRREGHPACNKMGDDGDGHWLVRMEWRPAGWSVCLPLLIFPCTIKSRSSLLAPDHPSGPGKRAVKRLSCGVRFRFAFLRLRPVLFIFYCVRFSFFSTKPRDWLGRSLKWSILCWVGHKTLTQSISGDCKENTHKNGVFLKFLLALISDWWKLHVWNLYKDIFYTLTELDLCDYFTVICWCGVRGKINGTVRLCSIV